MPLDGHSFLVSQGWSGHGTGLRQDSIVRPLAIPQKRTLAGLGKDRDEAFPFWDHLFSVAAKTIQVKLSNDDDSSDAESTPGQASLDRTTTGILSNKPPKLGTPASSSVTPASGSGTNTPTNIPASSSNLLVAAKREAARRSLYARFFRGPILGPDSESSPSGPIVKGKERKGSDWNLDLGKSKAGGRTPMAIAKAKLTNASDAVIPVKKRKRDEGVQEQEEKKQRKRDKEEKREKKKRNKIKSKNEIKPKHREDGNLKQDSVKGARQDEVEDDWNQKCRGVIEKEEKKRKKSNKERTDNKDKDRKSEHNHQNRDFCHGNTSEDEENERQLRKRKRERKEAKKAAAAALTAVPQTGMVIGMVRSSPPNVGLARNDQNISELKKTRKTVE